MNDPSPRGGAVNQPSTAPPATTKGGSSTWIVIVLVALGAAVFIVGTMAVFAIYGVRKYIANAKVAEARYSVAQLAKDATLAFERDGKLCASASAPVPATVPGAAKYQSSAADWQRDKAANAGFSCLRFEMVSPQYYQYTYTSTPTSFTATAHGDIDGDGHASTFEIEGHVSGGTVLVSPTIKEIDPFD